MMTTKTKCKGQYDVSLFGRTYQLGILHIFMKDLCNEALLDDHVEEIRLDAICYIQGGLHDVFGPQPLVSGVYHGETLLKNSIKITTFKDYIKVIRYALVAIEGY